MRHKKIGEIILYQPNNLLKLEVRLEDETVWLTQAQIADLFSTKRPAITKHLSNIFHSGELIENSVCSILEHTANDGKTYQTKFYNLDAIIYTPQISSQLRLDLQKHNAQYPSINIQIVQRSHDRFLFIDSDVYHIGASLKDLGKKWFAFSKIRLDTKKLISNII